MQNSLHFNFHPAEQSTGLNLQKWAMNIKGRRMKSGQPEEKKGTNALLLHIYNFTFVGG